MPNYQGTDKKGVDGDKLKEENDKLNEENDKLNEENDELQKENSKLKTELRKLKGLQKVTDALRMNRRDQIKNYQTEGYSFHYLRPRDFSDDDGKKRIPILELK